MPLTETATVHIDSSGLACPLPLLKLKKALHQHATGTIVVLLATDYNSQTDIKRFCEVAGHQLLNLQLVNDKYEFTIQK